MDFGGNDCEVERTFVMVKPEGVLRGLAGEIIGRFERRGLRLSALKLVKPNLEQLIQHYAEHKDRPYFGSMIQHLSSSGPVVAMVWSGPESVSLARNLIGSTDPSESRCGTARGDLAVSVKRTAVHGADSTEAAEREMAIWFNEDEIHK
jgi:nucleoside-diphosphate kinase